MKRSEALQQRKELLKLIKQWTEAEVMARYSTFENLEFIDYALAQMDKKNEIRRLVFGTDDISALAIRWGFKKEVEKKEKRRKKNANG